MSKEKSPAFQWYPKDYMTSLRVAQMSLEEEGAYIRCINFCWLHGSLPNDENQIVKIIGKGGSLMVARVVQAMFEQMPNDPTKLVHERLESEREKQESWRNKSRDGGIRSAESRANKRSGKGGSTVVQPPPQPNPNSPVSLFNIYNKEKFEKEVKDLPGFDEQIKAVFLEYWLEPNAKKTKYRFQGEKYFDIKKRLNTFKTNQAKRFYKNESGQTTGKTETGIPRERL